VNSGRLKLSIDRCSYLGKGVRYSLNQLQITGESMKKEFKHLQKLSKKEYREAERLRIAELINVQESTLAKLRKEYKETYK